MLNTIHAKEEHIINNLLNKELKMKRRPQDSYYPDGSLIFYNEDGIFYSAETFEKMEEDIKNIILKLKNINSFLEDLTNKIQVLKS
jgi:hypothetical protein